MTDDGADHPTLVLPAPASGPEPTPGAREVARRALESSGGLLGITVAAAPTAAFVTANALAGLTPALITLAVVALAAFVLRLARHASLTGAVIGLVIAGVCAVIAAVTGEARAFFLLPTLLPLAILLVCLASVVVRRPVTGLIFNRVVGGPTRWRDHRPLMRVYTWSTLAAVAVNIANVAVQAVFYLADRPAVLAAAHIATGPAFAALAAATLVAARRHTGAG